MDELEKIKKKLKKDFEENMEVNENSDIPLSEKKVKYRKFKDV